MQKFIAGLPKVELHVHHVGSASPRIVAELAAKYAGDTRVPADPQELSEFFRFGDFSHFIEVYLAVSDLIRDAEDVRMLTFEAAREMAEQNIRYAELTVTPYPIVERVPGEDFLDAIEDARDAASDELGVELRWCFDVPGRVGGEDVAQQTLDLALQGRPDGLISFGLGGLEVPRPPFAPYFDKAIAAGLRSVPHAGETTGPQAVWDALTDLKAERIGHGIKAIEDPALVAHLAETGIPLEVCPTSNLATGVVERIEDHPIKALIDAGVTVTVNSDDPPMFGTNLEREYALVADLLGLDEAGVAGLSKTAIRASFLPPDEKARLSAQVDGYLAAWTAQGI